MKRAVCQTAIRFVRGSSLPIGSRRAVNTLTALATTNSGAFTLTGGDRWER
jgi:hypothetical protein